MYNQSSYVKYTPEVLLLMAKQLRLSSSQGEEGDLVRVWPMPVEILLATILLQYPCYHYLRKEALMLSYQMPTEVEMIYFYVLVLF